MSTGWVRSLQCKSNATDDVYRPKKAAIPLSSCGAASSQALKDVVFFLPKNPSSAASRRPKPPQPPPSPPRSDEKPDRRHRSKPKPKHRPKPPPSSPSPPPPPRAFPTLAELPAGHSSRRVVEIIFASSWSPRAPPFEIEMLFRVHSPPRVAARFEDYRAAVRSRSADARCAADGNEMMRFHCSPRPAGAAVYDAAVVPCAVAAPGGRAVQAIRTFAGSGGAHESAASGGQGRRAMLVCRVIAGRIRSEPDRDQDGESVCGGPGELLVFDPRAVLPCFLIIYKV